MGKKKSSKNKKGAQVEVAAPKPAANLSVASPRTPPQAPTPIDPLTAYPNTGIAEPRRVRSHQIDVQLGLFAVRVVERNVPGMDDPVYEKNPNVWELVPRGQANVFLRGSDGSFGRPLCSLVGLRKFGYRESRYGYRERVKMAIAVEKENGECGHLCAFSFGGTSFWVVGSKHVHVVFRDRCHVADLAQFNDAQRFHYAKKIAQLWIDTMEKMAPVTVAQFHTALASSRCTACFEAIFNDSQHIVDYGGVTQMQFFALGFDGPSEEGLARPPDEARRFFAGYGLSTAQMSAPMAYPGEEYSRFLEDVARRPNSEGVVVYGSDASGSVCCMWKEKSYPYVMERVAREAIKRGLVADRLTKQLQKKLREQNKEVRKYFAAWEEARMPWLISFASWLHITGRWTRDEWALSTRWLSLQGEFHNVSAEIFLQVNEATAAGAVVPCASATEVVIFVGPPGCGKSTLCRALFGMLQSAKCNPKWINQDESGGNRNLFFANIKKAMTDPTVTHLLIDKINLTSSLRKDYTELGLIPTVTAVLTHSGGEEAFRDECLLRLKGRGEGHRTLKVMGGDTNEAEQVFDNMMASFVPPTDESVMLLDIARPLEANLAALWSEISQRGATALPEFDASACSAAVGCANRYESLLARMGGASHVYACIELEDDALPLLLSLFPAKALDGKDINTAKLHVTTKFFGGEMDPVWFVEFSELLGKKVALAAVEAVYDSKGCAVVVAGEFKCPNKIPHVTIATAPGVPPFYSNELIAKSRTTTKGSEVADPDGAASIAVSGLSLEGTFAFH